VGGAGRERALWHLELLPLTAGSPPPVMIRAMLKGTRDAILRKVQPVSVHGQISWDVYFSHVEDPDGPTHVARVGPETVSHRLEPGDRIRLEYVLGSVVGVTKIQP
jgi:hypothetical protein